MDSQCAGGQTFSRQKMVQDIYSSRTYVWIRRIVLVAHGVAPTSVGIVILLGYMSGLEEWFLYQSVE
jgi:hypothetical protein